MNDSYFTNDTVFLAALLSEVQKARKKFPEASHTMIALAEEHGELAKAIMDEPAAQVWAEAVQVAAMALRVAVEGDLSINQLRESRGLDRVPVTLKVFRGPA